MKFFDAIPPRPRCPRIILLIACSNDSLAVPRVCVRAKYYELPWDSVRAVSATLVSCFRRAAREKPGRMARGTTVNHAILRPHSVFTRYFRNAAARCRLVIFRGSAAASRTRRRFLSFPPGPFGPRLPSSLARERRRVTIHTLVAGRACFRDGWRSDCLGPIGHSWIFS